MKAAGSSGQMMLSFGDEPDVSSAQSLSGSGPNGGTDLPGVHLLRLRFDTMPPLATAQQKGAFVRGGRVHFFTKKRVRQQENNMVALVHSELPKGWQPLEGPLVLHIHLCYPYRKQERKSVIRSGREIPHDCRPDLDNLLKGLVDSLVTAGLIRDDGQVADLFATKRRGPRPYWTVEVGRAV